MELLDRYLALQAEIFAYFGYTEDWKVLPLEDARRYYWIIEQGDAGIGRVLYFDDPLGVNAVAFGVYYANDVYAIHRGDEYTMLVVETDLDGGGKLLQIFTNAREQQELIADA